MGHQISLLCAIHGYKTTCTDVSPEVLKKAEKFADTYLPRRVEKGKMTRGMAEKARKNISFTGDLEEAAKDADYMKPSGYFRRPVLLVWPLRLGELLC
jgi:3-hydroxybutyryl-CoA dehydrogenase